MPLYEYRCQSCKKVFEVIQTFAAKPKRKCEECGGGLEKLVSRSGFVLKGGGWYKTDYGTGLAGTKPSDSSGSSSPDSGGSSSSDSEGAAASNSSGSSSSDSEGAAASKAASSTGDGTKDAAAGDGKSKAKKKAASPAGKPST